ncbi:hypothetical protein CLOM_g12014 [Closterium sp. NIES-68]|nr:hypothetical protein CLOM_g12014 [Closterium sp. NIES-68]GJP84596.1 hypothetical protein CLOP_g14652 [Closterium sp. NIES-67]
MHSSISPFQSLSTAICRTCTQAILPGSYCRQSQGSPLTVSPRHSSPPGLSLRASASNAPAVAEEKAEKAEKKAASRGPSAAGPPAAGKAGGAGGKAEMIDVSPPRGTRDFPPDDMRLRNWLFGHFRQVSTLFGFEEVDYPVLESEELFVRKAGEEITQQLYNFEDKGGRRVALRPELTPSLARLVLQKGKSLPLPVKWFAIGQCWRYERMTRGRRREHYQWNMDVLGVPGVEAEAELLAAVVAFFTRVGLSSKDVGIRVSNRKVLQEVVDGSGVPADKFAAVCVIVDKRDKIGEGAVGKELAELGVSETAARAILGTMKITSLQQLREHLAASGVPESGSAAVGDLERLFVLAEAHGFADWLEFDASVVRGLAYYTGTVFEAFDRAGELRAICGGGRYDRLLSTFGAAADTPACGFGFGDAVIVELLKQRGLLPALQPTVDDIIVPLDQSLNGAAASLAARLRQQGRRVDLVLETKRLKWAFKQAERVNASRMIILGSSEWERGVVKVKDLAAREEVEVPVADVV